MRTAPALWEKLKPIARQMRHEPTIAEQVLWERIRNRALLNSKFRRQHPIDRFIVDFCCDEAKLIIEVDGEIHQYTQAEDAIRQEFLESLGYRVARFSNEHVLEATSEVVSEIKIALLIRSAGG